jgi:hypothetical protein
MGTTKATNDLELARLSSTVTVEDGGNDKIVLVRQNVVNGADTLITLRPEAEAALLALLLKRKGVTLSA